MVNKNIVSQVTKLLIQPQFKVSPLQFFSFSAAASIVDLFIYVFVFTLCLGVFFVFLEKGGGGGGCSLHFSPFTSCGIRRTHFLPVIRSAALLKQLSGSNQKNGWSGCNIELLNIS